MNFLDRIFFPKVRWWLLLLVPLTIIGFYPTYFSKLLSPMANVFHLHAIFIMFWILMAIIQPFLVKKNKLKMHRIIGKISYLIMPIVFVTSYLVIQHVYYSTILKETEKVTNGLSTLTANAIIEFAKEYIAIGLVYLLWLMVFYTLAVIQRKKVVDHATYMFAAMLTLLGPTVDRILFQIYQYLGISFNFFAEVAVFLLIDFLLIALLLFQWKKGNSLRAVTASLLIYITGQFVYFFLPKTEIWKTIVGLIIL